MQPTETARLRLWPRYELVLHVRVLKPQLERQDRQKNRYFSSLHPRRGLHLCSSLILVLLQARGPTPAQLAVLLEKKKALPVRPAFPDHIPSVLLVLASSGCPDRQKQIWLEPMVRGAPTCIKAFFAAAGYDAKADSFSGPVRSWVEVTEALQAYIARHPSRPSFSATQADKVPSPMLSFFAFPLFSFHILSLFIYYL